MKIELFLRKSAGFMLQFMVREGIKEICGYRIIKLLINIGGGGSSLIY